MDPDDRGACAAGSVVEGVPWLVYTGPVVHSLHTGTFVCVTFCCSTRKSWSDQLFLSGQILRILVHSCVFLCAALGYVEVGLAQASNDGNSCRLGSGPMLAKPGVCVEDAEAGGILGQYIGDGACLPRSCAYEGSKSISTAARGTASSCSIWLPREGRYRYCCSASRPSMWPWGSSTRLMMPLGDLRLVKPSLRRPMRTLWLRRSAGTDLWLQVEFRGMMIGPDILHCFHLEALAGTSLAALFAFLSLLAFCQQKWYVLVRPTRAVEEKVRL